MLDNSNDIYLYINPKIILQLGFGGKEFLVENINAHISTITCIKEITNSCVHNNEFENLKHCLAKLKSSIAEFKVASLAINIDSLIAAAMNNKPKIEIESKLKDFLLICELVIIDLENLKKNEGLLD